MRCKIFKNLQMNMTMKNRGLLKDLERNLAGYQEKRDNMNVLEKILEEIEHEAMTNKEIGRKQCEGMARTMNIIRSHMDEAKDINVPSNVGWIPVEERLPNLNGVYNVTRLIDDAFISDSAYFDGQDTWHNDNRVNHARPYLTDIVAWQPLPKQYKPKKQD